MASVRTSSLAVEQLLGRACARNAPAEVHYDHSDGTVITCRVRLLELTNKQVITDTPTQTSGDGRIPCGSLVTIHFSLSGSRYQFASRIERSGVLVRLNDRKRIVGVVFSKPMVITDSQRRAHLRVLLVSYDSVCVDLARPHPQAPDACLRTAGPLRGAIVDLSVGGLAILTKDPAFRSAARGERFFLAFRLPAAEREFLMLGAVRHTRAVENSRAVRVALAFCPWAGGRFQRDQADLAKFVATHQRRILRRRK